jgi:beta-lactamase superfamily II metal-dependent hydrolase
MASLKISILNVGHGDFIYAVTPLGENLVIDCGSGNDVVPSAFLSRVVAISELQVSHPHIDHFQDIIALSSKRISSFRCPNLQRFSDAVISWRSEDADKIRALRNMQSTIQANNNAVRSDANFNHSVWFPSNIDSNDPNTACCITILSYRGFKILFGGDLPESGWGNLLQQQF